jgi:peptidyl-prolyl cis-trans isomerase D
MFRLFRKNREAIKKYLLIFFLSIVSFGMVITLMPLGGGDASRAEANVLASVDGHNITTQELSQSIRTRFQNSQYGYDSRLVPVVAGSVLDDMVIQQALVAQARKLGVEVSDQEVVTTLHNIPWLYPEGNFVGVERATELVQQQAGMTLPQFETLLRQSLVIEKVRGIVSDGVQVTPADLLTEFRQRNAKAKIDYVIFDPSQLIKDVKVTPEGLSAYFQKDPSRYKLPEQRQVRYVLLDPEQVRTQVKIDEAELRQYYAQNLSDYHVPDRVKVAHILFKTTGKTPAEVAAIEKTAADVLNQIRAGGNFAELAKKYSEDTSAQQGGEIGWIVRGQTVKEFEDTAFSMKPGAVSGLVKTIYGIHILKLEDKQSAHLQSFDEVKDSIRAELVKQRLADAQDKLASQLQTQLKADPQQFDAVVRKAGLEPKESPLFKYAQAVPDLGNADAFESLAFQLRPGEVGAPISVPKGAAIIQLAQIVPEHVPTLDEVRTRVEEDYRHDQANVLAADKARQLAQKAKTEDFNKAAKAAGFAAKQSKDFSQSEYLEGVGNGTQLAAAFTLAPGKTSEVVSLGANSVVFRVVSHTPANEADFPAQRDQIHEELLDQKRNLAFEIYRQNLRQQLLRTGELKMNDAAMKQFLASYQSKD